MFVLISVSVVACGARSVSGDEGFAPQYTPAVPPPTIMGTDAAPTGSGQQAQPESTSTVRNPEPTAPARPVASNTMAAAQPNPLNRCECPDAHLGVTVWFDETQATSTEAEQPLETDAGASMSDDGGSGSASTFLGYLAEPIDDGGCGDGQLHLMPDVRCGMHLWRKICQGPDATLPCIDFQGNDVAFTDTFGRTFNGSLREGRMGLDEDAPRGLLQGSFALPLTDGNTELELQGRFAFCGFSYRSGIVC